jgi:hypothetical protein
LLEKNPQRIINQKNVENAKIEVEVDFCLRHGGFISKEINRDESCDVFVMKMKLSDLWVIATGNLIRKIRKYEERHLNQRFLK